MEMNRWGRIETPGTTSEPGLPFNSGNSMKETYLLIMGCPVYRRRDSNLGFRTELENLAGDAKGKGTSGSPVRPKLPMRWPGSDCSIVVKKRSNFRGAKGAGHPGEMGSTGNRRSPWSRRKAVAFQGWHEPDKSRGLRPDL
jgi:hypothetical protein